MAGEGRYESDLTKKEKRQRELEKLKSMTLGGKIEYIWMYYKIWFAVVAILVAAVYVGFTMYQGSKANVLVNVVIVGGDAQDTEKIEVLEQEIKQKLGAKGKYDTVRVQANIPEDGGSTQSQTALTTLFGANAIDILICPQNIYEEYASQGGFAGDTLVLDNEGKIKEIVQVLYDEIHVAIPINAEHKEAAKTVMKYLSEYSQESD